MTTPRIDQVGVTAVASFGSRDEARQAVRALRLAGIRDDQIGVLSGLPGPRAARRAVGAAG